jgi:hypothetical protein
MCSGKQQAPIFNLQLTWSIVLFVCKYGTTKLGNVSTFFHLFFLCGLKFNLLEVEAVRVSTTHQQRARLLLSGLLQFAVSKAQASPSRRVYNSTFIHFCHFCHLPVPGTSVNLNRCQCQCSASAREGSSNVIATLMVFVYLTFFFITRSPDLLNFSSSSSAHFEGTCHPNRLRFLSSHRALNCREGATFISCSTFNISTSAPIWT